MGLAGPGIVWRMMRSTASYVDRMTLIHVLASWFLRGDRNMNRGMYSAPGGSRFVSGTHKGAAMGHPPDPIVSTKKQTMKTQNM